MLEVRKGVTFYRLRVSLSKATDKKGEEKEAKGKEREWRLLVVVVVGGRRSSELVESRSTSISTIPPFASRVIINLVTGSRPAFSGTLS